MEPVRTSNKLQPQPQAKPESGSIQVSMTIKNTATISRQNLFSMTRFLSDGLLYDLFDQDHAAPHSAYDNGHFTAALHQSVRIGN